MNAYSLLKIALVMLPFPNFAMELEQSSSATKESLISYTVSNTLDEEIMIKFFVSNRYKNLLLKPHARIIISEIPKSQKTSVQILKGDYPAIVLTPQFNTYEILFKDRDYILHGSIK